MTALCDEPEAFASDLDDDQSRYLCYYGIEMFIRLICLLALFVLCSSDGAEHRLRLSEVNEAGTETPGRP